jgi:hypothetical protein
MQARRTATLQVAPTTEPVTLDELKLWARIDSNDDDALLTSLIVSARQACENYTKRSFITQTWRMTLDLAGNSLDKLLGDGYYELPITALYGGLPTVIDLPRQPVQSITSITTFDLGNNATVYPSINYFLNADGARVLLNQGAVWPGNMRPIAACQIVYVTGYGNTAASVPQAIRDAIKGYAHHAYESRAMCDCDSMPAKFKSMLKQYRLMDGRA